MSRFRRPTFTAPKLPSPPKSIARISTMISAVSGLVSLAAKIQTVSLGSFSINTVLAQAKAQLATQTQRLVKNRILAKRQKPVIPDAIQADLAAVRQYKTNVEGLFETGRSKIDEFGQSLPF